MSGKKVVLLGDLGTDHEGFPPTPVINGSPDVLIDGKPVARVGDQLAQHSKPKHSPHPRTIASGTAKTHTNGTHASSGAQLRSSTSSHVGGGGWLSRNPFSGHQGY